MAHKLVHSIQNVAARHIFKQFATKFHFVYFGKVNARDEHEMVMGLTASTKHSDNFFTVGTFEGHDITLVVRRNTLSFPGKPDSAYNWLIAQVDLKYSHLPHIFIDFHHHDETFFANMAVAFKHMQDMSPGFSDIGARVMINPLQYGDVRMLLSPMIVAGLKEQFNQYSLEIKDDQLFVYANYVRPSQTSLEHILKLAAWLAGQLNQAKA